jgi:nucleoside-diphosphate-sugar epimerase
MSAGWELFHLNRGRRGDMPGVKTLHADAHDRDAVRAALGDLRFDVVADFIAYKPAEVERDIELFSDRCSHYLFISSATVYQKPPVHPVVTESTPRCNPFWEYARDKIACEQRLEHAHRSTGFPATIVRPSLTYATRLPIALGSSGSWSVVERMRRGEPVIVHGDGSSLWTVTHSDDFARGFVGLMGNPATIGHAFHITADELLSWDRIYQTIGDALGVKPRLVHIPSDFLCRVEPSLTGNLLGDKTHSSIFDNTKIKSFVPGFRCKIPFHVGVRKVLAWFDADPARQVADQKFNAMTDRLLANYADRSGTVTP